MSLTQEDIGYLTSLSCGKCDMQHERIAYHRNSKIPLSNAVAEHGFARVGLCPTAGRLVNLTCAHTSSRCKLVNLIKKIPDDLVAPQTREGWIRDIKDIDFKIVSLDVQKSDLEVRHAKVKKAQLSNETPESKSEIKEIEKRIEQVVTNYHVQVAAMSNLQEKINRTISVREC